MRNNEIKSELDEITGWKKINSNNLKYETNKHLHDFQNFKKITLFGVSKDSDKITISVVDEDQSNLLENIVEFNNKSRPTTKEDKMKKEILLIVQMLFMKIDN